MDMHRSRYGIRSEDCITHAQMSVNPSNMLVGAHTDWARGFPFSAMGLPDNYAIALPSLYAFGFNFDDVFLQMTGAGWKGLGLAEDHVRMHAEAVGLPIERYRQNLRHRYKDIAAALKESEGG